MPDWIRYKARLEKCKARLDEVQGQTGHGKKPEWTWHKARLDTAQGQTGHGVRPDWKWYKARLDTVKC